jgi:hypothetical protein
MPSLTPLCSYITDPNDKQLVIQTLKLVSLFYRQLTDDEIKEGGYLFQQIIEFRKLFAKAFLGQQPHPDHRLKKDPNKPDKPDWTFNLRLPTLSALLTVPTLLRYLGPSKFQDTSLVRPTQPTKIKLTLNSLKVCTSNGDLHRMQ